MLRSIISFRQSELESVILWNRILVYATLYGQAKKVSDVLKRYNIHLSNPSFQTVVVAALEVVASLVVAEEAEAVPFKT